MNLRCKDCKVTFDSPYNKDCPFCGSDAFVVELLHENKETEPDYWMIRGEIWSDDIAFLEAHNGTSSEVQAAMDEWENYAVPLYKSPVTTDKLSVEKLQEQLNTAKKALTEIAEIIDDNIHECNYGCDNNCELNGSLDMYSVENVQSVIDSTLAAIGGDDEN
ncbi:hypothetical protein ACGO3R_05480 [Lactococcus lactis]